MSNIADDLQWAGNDLGMSVMACFCGLQACSNNLEELEAKIGQINRLTTECRQLDTKQKTMLDHNAQTLANLQVSSVLLCCLHCKLCLHFFEGQNAIPCNTEQNVHFRPSS